MDSKLYPLMDSEITSRASRFLEINAQNYCCITHMQKAKGGESVFTGSVTLTLQEMDRKPDEINRKLSSVTHVQKAFECVICRSPAKSPVVAPCCQQILGWMIACKDGYRATHDARCALYLDA